MSEATRVVDRLLSEDGLGIEVRWGDGHVSVFPFRYLRGYCPCASCQGHGAGPMQWMNPAEDLALQGIRLVGRYGIQPVWSDGHDTGIFADTRLRSICPCSECLDFGPDRYGQPLG